MDLVAAKRDRQRAIWFAIALVTLAASVFVLGIGATILLAGTGVLAAGLSLTLPRISVPAAWAFALVAEISLVLSVSGLVSLVSPREQPPAVNLATLAAPLLLGAVLLVIARRRGRARPVFSLFFERVAILITAVVVAVAEALATRGPAYGIAWAMSGDARNHLLIMRSSIFHGGITIDQVRTYPAALNAIAGIVSGSTSRGGLPSGELLLHDARALAAVYILLVIAVAFMIVAALAAFLVAKKPLRGRVSVAVTIVLLMAAGMAVSPLVLGTALIDGSFSAYGGLAISLASLVIALSALQDDKPNAFGYLFLAPGSLILFVTWTLLAVVPVALILVVAFAHLRWSRRNRVIETRTDHRAMRAALFALPLGCLLVIGAVILINLPTLEMTFRTSGSITPVNGWVLPILALLLVVMAVTAPPYQRRFAIACLAVLAAAFGLAIWLMHLLHGWRDLTPSYYSQKMLWLVAASFVWLPFVPVLRLAEREALASARGQYAVASGLAALAVLLAFDAVTTVREPVSHAAEGWSQPSAEVIARVAREADVRKSFVLWRYAGTGDDRLGNFWSSLAWTSTASGKYLSSPTDIPGGFAYWAYFDTGRIDQLCALVAAYPHITVVTASPDTRGQLESCGVAHPAIDVITLLSP